MIFQNIKRHSGFPVPFFVCAGNKKLCRDLVIITASQQQSRRRVSGGDMKRIVYGILVLAVLLVGVTFTTKNAQVVELNYYFGVHWETPLSFMLLTTLTVGLALGLLASLAMQARMQRQLLQVRRENRQLEQEVNNLRALPIRDVP